MKINIYTKIAVCLFLMLSVKAYSQYSESFDDITTLVPGGWAMDNNSVAGGSTNWFQGNLGVFPPNGGTGYIGSHAAVVLAQARHQIILFDNLSNSDSSVASHIEKITNQTIPFVMGDVRDTALLVATLKKYEIELL